MVKLSNLIGFNDVVIGDMCFNLRNQEIKKSLNADYTKSLVKTKTVLLQGPANVIFFHSGTPKCQIKWIGIENWIPNLETLECNMLLPLN